MEREDEFKYELKQHSYEQSVNCYYKYINGVDYSFSRKGPKKRRIFLGYLVIIIVSITVFIPIISILY